MGNFEEHEGRARRMAEEDFKHDRQKRRIGKDGCAYQTWYDRRWDELTQSNNLGELQPNGRKD